MMITYNEWQQMNVGDDLLSSQLEQMVTKLQGLLHNVPEEEKNVLVDKFMRQVEERILGI